MKQTIYLLIPLLLVASCTVPKEEKKSVTKDIELVTDRGTIIIRLYDETPQHRDNFMKLVEDQFYDSIIFHRVIENFMIQAGDPDSRVSNSGDTLGSGELPYTIPAEFHPELFHKRGALGAARNNNPARASSSTQFYIVQGRVYADSVLNAQLGRVNNWLAMNLVVNDSANQRMINRRDQLFEKDPESDSISIISDRLSELAKLELANGDLYQYPEEHREVYKTVGGAAHLDQNYTVFGEVIQGMDVVDSIASTDTNDLDRPLVDIKILSTRLVDRKE